VVKINEKHLDGLAFVGAVATPVRIEIAALFKRIELRVSDVDRAAVAAVLPAAPMPAHRLAHLLLALAVIDYRLGVIDYRPVVIDH